MGPKEPQHTPDLAEQSKYRKMGYLRLMGSVNWAVRQCHLELGFHCSILASVMSTPSAVAWNAALKVLHWLYHNRDTGLCYRSDGNTEPIFYYDSSFIQFADSKAQYCVVGQLADGPITYVSHKHEPILDSTVGSRNTRNLEDTEIEASRTGGIGNAGRSRCIGGWPTIP